MTKHTRIRYLLYQVSKQKKHSCQKKQAFGKKKNRFALTSYLVDWKTLYDKIQICKCKFKRNINEGGGGRGGSQRIIRDHLYKNGIKISEKKIISKLK